MSDSILFPATEYDQDLLSINNAGFFGYQCNITTITAADSPYSIVETDYGIFIDATAGAVEVILVVDNVNKPNRALILKKIDSTSNTITITPEGTDTIFGGVSTTLIRENEVLQICRCDDASNWVLTNDRPDLSMTAKGDLFVRDATGLTVKPVGMDGYIFVADSSTPDGTRWAMPSTIKFNPTYHIIPGEAVACGPTFMTVATFPWRNIRYSGFGPGRCIFYAELTNRDLEIRIVDVKAGNIVIGSSGTLAAPSDASHEFSFTNPVADTYLRIQLYSNSQGGFQPRIFGLHFEFGI